jgi:hypothetical protein
MIKGYMNKEDLKVFIEVELKSLERGIVATPNTREDLEEFAKANHGSNDTLLTQMAIQFGYKLGLETLSELLKD